MVSLGCRVVELAHFVSVLSLFINSVLSSMAKLPQGQVSLGSGTRFSWCCGGLFPPSPFFKLMLDSPSRGCKFPRLLLLGGRLLPFLPQRALAGARMWRAELRQARSGSVTGTVGKDGADPNTSPLLGDCHSVTPVRPLRVGVRCEVRVELWLETPNFLVFIRKPFKFISMAWLV